MQWSDQKWQVHIYIKTLAFKDSMSRFICFAVHIKIHKTT